VEPATVAGIRTFTPHALRHTFAVLMLQSGASLKYVSEQMGHSSITGDVYGPGANISQMDRLNFAPQQNANGAQTRAKSGHKSKAENIDLLALRGNTPNREHLIAY
jgi:hypothetical protein